MSRHSEADSTGGSFDERATRFDVPGPRFIWGWGQAGSATPHVPARSAGSPPSGGERRSRRPAPGESFSSRQRGLTTTVVAAGATGAAWGYTFVTVGCGAAA
jgi:hypothetical protein